MKDEPFLSAAEREFIPAAAWHERSRPGLGGEFVEAIEDAVQHAVEHPERGSPYLFGTRRIVLDRFRYSVVYVVRSERVAIIAVAHHRRRPGYWRRRLWTIH
ncbi:MAG TPA: type II toxin-antitoxin system RelE/ParE family toxin [Longimicrobium sp.]|nr:type II toxin-antitoxin system RelE/ParE family toxin [Longimicrobium sp.]